MEGEREDRSIRMVKKEVGYSFFKFYVTNFILVSIKDSNNCNMKLQNNSLTIPSNVDSITLIERMVDDLSSSHCIDTELYGKVLLAVVEGVNNAVVHGNKLNPNKYVTVKYSIDKEFITFSIIDQGDGFDVDAISFIAG